MVGKATLECSFECMCQTAGETDNSAIRERLHRGLAEREQCVARAMESLDGLYAFAYIMQIIRSDAPEAGDHDRKPTLAEFAAFYLYANLRPEGSRDPAQITEALRVLRGLHDHQAFRVMRLGETSDDPFEESTVHLQMQRTFVRGAAYPSQTKARINALLSPFANELTALTGIAPSRVLALIDAFMPIVEQQIAAARSRYEGAWARLNEVSVQHDGGYVPKDDVQAFGAATRECDSVFEDGPWRFFVSFNAAAEAVSGLTSGEWNSLAALCGLTTQTRATLTEWPAIKDRPFYFVPERGFTIFQISNVYDAVFGAYDRLARSTVGLQDPYGRHVSDWMEREIERYLLQLFPAAHVFRKLDYPDPDRSNATAELDLAVCWGGCFVPIEAKGRQFRPAAETIVVRNDVRTNIAEAFWQCRRVLRYLDSAPRARFVERETGRVLEFDRTQVTRRFPIVVTLEHFGGLATQLATIGADGWFRAGTYPWAVSHADLEIITRFAGTPDVLLHYARRRIELQESRRDVSGDELDLFSHYLDNRLHPSLYWDRRESGRPFSMLTISDGEEKFSARLEAEAANATTLPEVALQVPATVADVLAALRQSSLDDDRAIALSLLDLSPAALNRLAANIERLNTIEMPRGKQPRIIFREGDVLVVALGNRGLNPVEHFAMLRERTILEKYRSRAPKAVGLGFDQNPAGSRFSGALWLEHPWVFDESAERDVQATPLRFIPGTRAPGRNDQCPCGSGLKFKRCCLERVDFM
jgi:hypothetical protein